MGGTRDKESRFRNYWKDPERIRERNRVYYYKKRGLPVPEKRVYTLGGIQHREEALKEAQKKLKELEEKLEEKEAELKFREEQLVKIEKSYTLKSYQPTYKPPSELKKKPVCAVGSAPVAAAAPKPVPQVSFTISNRDFS